MEEQTTPMMKQYLEIKSQYTDCLLFFRMGDFFELFFDDAKIASATLDIALTHRGKHLEENIPMCGVPAASLDLYMQKLIKSGFRVAICDQTETPQEAKKRGYKAIVKRAVVRIATSGTITEDNLLQAKHNNFLISIIPHSFFGKAFNKDCFSFSAIDISTGTFVVETIKQEALISELSRFEPKEILCASSLIESIDLKEITELFNASITPIPDVKFSATAEKIRLEKIFNVQTLDSFGQFNQPEISVCGALVEYLSITQKSQLPRLSPPIKIHTEDFMQIDIATRKSLELLSTDQQNSMSLADCLDETSCSAGARLLRSRLSAPILSIPELNSRLHAIEFFVNHSDLIDEIRQRLKYCPDLERSLSRVMFLRASLKDVLNIKLSIEIYSELKQKLSANLLNFDTSSGELGDYFKKIKDFSHIQNILEKTLIDTPPNSHKEGGFVKKGYNEELDKLNDLKTQSHLYIDQLREKYVSITGVQSLKIRQNNIWGWYVEVPSSQSGRMPKDLFTHRQTLVNAVRYVTTELTHLQEQIENSQEAALEIELKIYHSILSLIAEEFNNLKNLANALAVLDLSSSMAFVTKKRNYSRPSLSESYSLYIKGGRHPIVEQITQNSEQTFVPNDCFLDEMTRVDLLTGPNMSGKSTFLRQNALIIIMAQSGFFVPAKHTEIGVVDKIFSRIGASDELARGRSTFMVEMIETSAILHQASDKSFVILDEVGRGTSTFDGLSLAWAILEQIHNQNKCRALFATHYHELTNVAKYLKGLKCQTPKIQDWNGKLIFHHEIIDGTASKSYGLHVAEMAGIPQTVIKRAQIILDELERGKTVSVTPDLLNNDEEKYENNDMLGMLEMYDLDNLSPKQALDTLFELKNKFKNKIK